MASRVIDVTMQLIDKITEPLSGINGKLKDSGRQWQSAGRDIIKTGESITRTGRTLTTNLTMPIVGAGVGAVKTAANFEAGMSKVQAISGATEDQMGSLTSKAMEMGAKTKFSATEASDAFSYMAMAGWKTEEMMSGIEGVMYLAGATGEDLAMTSDIVTDAMTAFGMAADGTSTVLKDGVAVEVSNTTRFVDVLAATANNANTNVEMLGESFKYVAPVAGALGYNVEDVAVALGTMANSGIKASQAGTSLRTLLTNMANPSDKMAQAMETLGVSLDDGQGNMKTFAQVMDDLRSGFGNLAMSEEEYNNAFNSLTEAYQAGTITEKEYDKATDELIDRLFGAEGAQKAQAAAMLAGKTGMSGLLAIVNASDDDFNSLTTAINESSGACEKMYNVTQDNLLGRLTILKSTIESIAIAFGNELSPYVEKATQFLQKLADKFNSLDASERQQIVKILAIAAAIGPALMGFGKLTTGVGKVVLTVGKFGSSLGKAFAAAGKVGAVAGKFGSLGTAVAKAGTFLGTLVGPGAIVVAVLAAIGVAIFLCIKYWDQIKAAVQTAWEVITNAVTQIKDAIVQRFQEAGVTMEFLKSKIEPIKERFIELGNKIMEIYTTYIKPNLEAIGTILQQVWTIISPILQKIGEIFIEIFKIRLKAAIDFGLEVFKLLYTTITSVIESVIGVFTGWIDFIVGVFTGDWERAWQGVVQMFESVFSGIKGIAEGVFNFISGLINGVISLVQSLIGLFGQAKEAGSGVGEGVGKNALGTSYWDGGLTQINEQGGEIIDLPRGSRIYPHDESVKMAYQAGQNNGGGSGKAQNISINIPKLADTIQVRSDADIEAIAVALANKLERTAQNLGGEQLGYIY
jgi:TP901 family phage tail tape measure protein